METGSHWSDSTGAKPWLDVAKRIAFKNKKAGKLIKLMNASARASGDDVSKWWVVAHNVDINKSIAHVQATKMQVAA